MEGRTNVELEKEENNRWRRHCNDTVTVESIYSGEEARFL